MESRGSKGSQAHGIGWGKYRRLLIEDPTLGIRLDVSRMPFGSADLERLRPSLDSAHAQMRALEGGAIANPDENRAVGHYWLRDPDLAPEPALAAVIRESWEQIRSFANQVHTGNIRPPAGRAHPRDDKSRFRHLLFIGIGGSALGPQLMSDALARAADPLRAHFLDNTDPDGIDRALADLGDELAETLIVITSKSGGTDETRNGMLEVEAALARLDRNLGAHAVAITLPGSPLHALAREKGFLGVFPVWDWVGGRTSITSAVGLLPAALLGFDIDAFLEGSRLMDRWTRSGAEQSNPAAALASMWYLAGQGRGSRDMVILPYKDRLLLLGRYLQQLVMESLGKECDLAGRAVHQGMTVYGNKGSTDQHAYVQQLRDGPDDFFVTFIEVLRDRAADSRIPPIEVGPDVTSGDYLLGFLLGTREALTEKSRGSILITLPDVSARSLGALIALYERAVGLYASLVGINAYHQPGVEAGKRAARTLLDLQRQLLATLRAEASRAMTAEEVATRIGRPAETEGVFHILEHLTANGRLSAERQGSTCDTRYRCWL